MKRLLLLFLLLCNTAWADITAEHFSFAQVFDVQWYISGSTLNASGFNYLYASVNASGQLSAARLTLTQTNIYDSAGDYLAFFYSTTNPGTFGLGVYSSSGTLVRTLDYTGTFVALANGAIFYNGNGSWGTLFTTAQGYNYGSSGSWTITQSYPSNTYMTNYNPPNTQPLGAGQTASSPTVTSTVNSTIITTTTSGSTVYTYSQPITTTNWSDGTQTVANNGSATLLSTTITGGSGGITTNEQNAVTTVHNTQTHLPSTSHIYIDQIGSGDNVTIIQNNQYNLIGGNSQPAMKIRGGNNTVVLHQGDSSTIQSIHNIIATDLLGGSNTLTVNQGADANGNGSGTDTGYHYAGVYVNGVNNSVNIQQQATTSNNTGNYASVSVTGNQNNLGIIQTGAAPKQLFTTVTGNQNTELISQTGLGQHLLEVDLSGNGNSATVNQSGSTANSATISLINAGGPASVNLTQTGGQSYGITQTCVQAGGCGTVTVRQGP